MNNTFLNKLENLRKACNNSLLCNNEKEYTKEQLIVYYNAVRIEAEDLLDTVIKKLNRLDDKKRYSKGF